jgi:hypothetical protein
MKLKKSVLLDVVLLLDTSAPQYLEVVDREGLNETICNWGAISSAHDNELKTAQVFTHPVAGCSPGHGEHPATLAVFEF